MHRAAFCRLRRRSADEPAVVRRTGLSLNTIKKYLREGAAEPKFKTPSRLRKLDLSAITFSKRMA